MNMQTSIVKKMEKMENSPIAPIDTDFCKIDFKNEIGKVFNSFFIIEPHYSDENNALYVNFVFPTYITKKELNKLIETLEPAGYEFLSVSIFYEVLHVNFVIDNLF